MFKTAFRCLAKCSIKAFKFEEPPHLNVIHMTHNFRPKRHRFFAYIKKPKICKIQNARNAGPELNLESDKMGHLLFMGKSDS